MLWKVNLVGSKVKILNSFQNQKTKIKDKLKFQNQFFFLITKKNKPYTKNVFHSVKKLKSVIKRFSL